MTTNDSTTPLSAPQHSHILLFQSSREAAGRKRCPLSNPSPENYSLQSIPRYSPKDSKHIVTSKTHSVCVIRLSFLKFAAFVIKHPCFYENLCPPEGSFVRFIACTNKTKNKSSQVLDAVFTLRKPADFRPRTMEALLFHHVIAACDLILFQMAFHCRSSFH